MKPFSILFFLFINLNLFTQTNLTQTISGSIKDAETNQEIFGANVVLLNTKPLLGTTSDINGNFKITNVPIGLHNIKISYLGYENIFFNDVYITAAKGLNIDAMLQEDIVSVKEINITAKRNKENINEMASVSVNTVTSKEAERISGGIADPQRIMLSYAGVKNQGDVNNGISIRGNNPTSMQWHLEGIEIQDPNHFTLGGAFGGRYKNGAVNAISGNLLQNINLYTGAFPAQYGNATAGIMDLTLRKGNDKNFEYNFNLGVLGLEASAEGPLQMGGSFLVSFRYSTLDIMGNAGFDVGEAKIGYRDINYKVNLPTKKFGTFTAFGLAGWSDSKALTNFKQNEAFWQTTYNNSVFGFSHQINVSKKSYIKNIIAFSSTKNHYHDYISSGFNNEAYEKFTYRNNTQTLRYALNFHSKINRKNVLVSGIKINLPKVNFKKATENIDNIYFASRENISFKNASAYLQAYSQWKHKLNNKLHVMTGLHFNMLTYNSKYSIEPRFNLKWNPSQKHQINFGAGLFSKIEFLPIYMSKTTSYTQDRNYFTINIDSGQLNKNLELSKSFHIAASYIYKPFNDLSFKIEPYLQYHFHVPQSTSTRYIYEFSDYPNPPKLIDSSYYYFSTLNGTNDFYNTKLDNNGTGLNYGLEITAQKHFAKNYYLLIASSVYRSFYKVPKLERWKATSFDGLFTFSASAGKDFILGKLKQNKLSLNARILWSGGYIGFNEFGNEERSKNYYKLDTRIAYILNKKNFTFTTALDLLNTTNHKNETNDFLVQGTGILPVLSFNFRFQTKTKE
ncbi:MAG: TonB-dependent receptor [Chitinophagales bacterium]